MEIELLSPAKVNLFLKVISKRDDGYHEILSLMQPISLFDVIRMKIEQGSAISTRVTGTGVDSYLPPVPDGPDNLAYQAAELFLKKAKLERAVDIEIDKKIPSGAGLGGGSSNAASVMMGLNEALGQPIEHDELMVISAEIGSDVPFFLLKGSALASGRGEKLERISFPLYDYVLVNPGFEVASGWAYDNLDLTKKDEDNMLMYSKSALMDSHHIKDLLVNDLEPAVLERYPQILDIKKEFSNTDAQGVLMSGSGPTVFAVYPDLEKARAAYESVSSRLKAPNKVFLVRGGV
ncbi:MAG: 4-(cytidine 5'-diphospho)-2-C-methyl-D-erythritol kinase [Proteobacteria bacterium]|nr:4-(cytidine 5'-diphospho)-2-C-methyl-D-erythritol kinase [Pseudomonadota bacterium]